MAAFGGERNVAGWPKWRRLRPPYGAIDLGTTVIGVENWTVRFRLATLVLPAKETRTV